VTRTRKNAICSVPADPRVRQAEWFGYVLAHDPESWIPALDKIMRKAKITPADPAW
jgi:hypothetical protein